MTGQMTRGLRPASDGVNEVCIVTAGREGRTRNVGKVGRGPRCLLTVLDDDGITSEQSADDGSKQIMERVTVAISITQLKAKTYQRV